MNQKMMINKKASWTEKGLHGLGDLSMDGDDDQSTGQGLVCIVRSLVYAAAVPINPESALNPRLAL